MVFEPWFVLHTAELADQAVTHLTAAAASMQHQMHMLLEEITDSNGLLQGLGGINGGCHENLL